MVDCCDYRISALKAKITADSDQNNNKEERVTFFQVFYNAAFWAALNFLNTVLHKEHRMTVFLMAVVYGLLKGGLFHCPGCWCLHWLDPVLEEL